MYTQGKLAHPASLPFINGDFVSNSACGCTPKISENTYVTLVRAKQLYAFFLSFLFSSSFFFSFLFPLLSCLVFSCFSCIFFLFACLFRFVSFVSFFFSFLSFPSSSFLFFVSFSPIDLRLSCVCVVINTTCNIYVVIFLGWQSEYLVSPAVSNDSCGQIDLRKARERELATFDEQSTSNKIAEPYAR